jgi:hypothetical protein
VSEAPTANGAILNIVINDVANAKDMKDAEAKGFVTGATFFVAGSNVVDHYICTVDYVGGPAATKITKGAEQSLIFQMGLINSAPQNAVKVGGLKDGLAALIRQLVTNPLNDLGKEPGFVRADVAPAPSAAAAAAPVPSAAVVPDATAAQAAASQPAAAPAAAPTAAPTAASGGNPTPSSTPQS